jgi:hypothetical protein
MNKKPETVTLTLDELLRDSKRQATSMSLPLAIHHRLDVLAERGLPAGATRADIIGMLIAQADLDQDSVVDGLVAYRKMTVREAVPEESRRPAVGDTGDGADVIELPVRHPGRPPSQRAAG